LDFVARHTSTTAKYGNPSWTPLLAGLETAIECGTKLDDNLLVEAALPTFPVLDSALDRDTSFLCHTENEFSETLIEPQNAAIVSHDPACSAIHFVHCSSEYRRCHDVDSLRKTPRDTRYRQSPLYPANKNC
jgi:hypothetical protein